MIVGAKILRLFEIVVDNFLQNAGPHVRNCQILVKKT